MSPSNRRRQVAMAGHLGDSDTAAEALSDPEPIVRATALEALARLGSLTAGHLSSAMSDLSPVVRSRAAELAGRNPLDPEALAGQLVSLLDDNEDSVVEAASFGLGEMADTLIGRDEVISALSRVSGGHDDPLCRETAVAALGAIGDPSGLAAVLAAMKDKPAVRRRAVLALSAFDGSEVEAALEVALSDRDWQVRQAAEDLTDRRS